LQIKILGGGGGIGNSAVLVRDGPTSVLMDYGVSPGKTLVHPMHVRPRDVTAFITTHAHLDHVGYAPYLYIDGSMPHYATKPTIELAEVLLNDLLKINGDRLPFGEEEVKRFIKHSVHVKYNEEFSIDGVKAELLNAGHIPGSAMVYLKGSKRVIYTGDINHIPTRLLEPASYDLPEADVIVSECTYALQDHRKRIEEETRLVDFSREITDGGGAVLIPSFAVGRAQEVAEIFYSHKFDRRVYMDGMAIAVNEILLNNQEFVKDPDVLARALDYVSYIDNWAERRRAVREPAAIISPAGMLVGGASVFYSRKISGNEKNGIAIVSYQVEGTPGRQLEEENSLPFNGGMKVKARTEKFELSSHSGRSQLLEMFKRVSGSPKVILVHGERENCQAFALELNNMGLDAVCADLGGEYDL